MTTLQELLEQWEARSKDALPTDAMLINKHIRELRTALAQQPVAWSYWQSCLNDDGTQTAPWVHRFSKFRPVESIINKDITPLYTAAPAPQPAQDVPETNFGNMQVQAVYALLCDPNEQPPEGEHWEGFMACRIVSVLRSAQPVVNQQMTTVKESLTPQSAQPVARPLTDAWIRERTKQPWVFDTVKQWVREIEAAHGIGRKPCS